MKKLIFAPLAGAVSLLSVAQPSSGQDEPSPLPPLNLTIKYLTPKFLTFYNEATKEKASPDKRWELWKRIAISPRSASVQFVIAQTAVEPLGLRQ